MFRQFTEHISGNQGYLLFSLGIFFLFFVVVTVLLVRLKKQHTEYMSDMPLNDAISETDQILQP
jgi:hypothetical protein